MMQPCEHLLSIAAAQLAYTERVSQHLSCQWTSLLLWTLICIFWLHLFTWTLTLGSLTCDTLTYLTFTEHFYILPPNSCLTSGSVTMFCSDTESTTSLKTHREQNTWTVVCGKAFLTHLYVCCWAQTVLWKIKKVHKGMGSGLMDGSNKHNTFTQKPIFCGQVKLNVNIWITYVEY